MTMTIILRGQCWNATECAKAYQETVGLKSTLSLLRLKPSICQAFLGISLINTGMAPSPKSTMDGGSMCTEQRKKRGTKNCMFELSL